MRGYEPAAHWDEWAAVAPCQAALYHIKIGESSAEILYGKRLAVQATKELATWELQHSLPGQQEQRTYSLKVTTAE
ncbi:hypothetical protein DSO57_1032020 [Entomophthora muscae]|uniref:Uncharacterized protein n=1 Tax=Entomophthora muscae TaxID=34485 RepID=A0ACC2T0Y6_9FUNG|nr:hypothetical protein DSO57_1032020 [Entomophthora muscae]